MIKVKALEWRDSKHNSWYSSSYSCAGISYEIGGYRCGWIAYDNWGDELARGEAESRDDAKAACQAHHEQHVLSMITEVADGAE